MSSKDDIEVPNTEAWVHLNGSLVSDSLVAMDETDLRPFPARPPPAHADKTLKFKVEMTGPSSWALNIGPHEAFRQQLPPLMWDESSRGRTSYGGDSCTDDVQNAGNCTSSGHGVLQNGTVVDIVFENGADVITQHPFHKHNHKAFIIGTGSGGFPWDSVDEAIRVGGAGVEERFNFIDPPIRDGCRLGNQTGDWTVVRYEIFFPAVSMLHCHMIHHFAVSRPEFFQTPLPSHFISPYCRVSHICSSADCCERLASRSSSWRVLRRWPRFHIP